MAGSKPFHRVFLKKPHANETPIIIYHTNETHIKTIPARKRVGKGKRQAVLPLVSQNLAIKNLYNTDILYGGGTSPVKAAHIRAAHT